MTTVRSIGSTPTAFVESIEKVRQLKQDHVRNKCDIELSDGGRIALDFHLFAARELVGYFANRFDVEDLRGLDLFHGRFAPDARWNPEDAHVDNHFSDELARLEEAYATHPNFIDRATHLLLVARRRSTAAPAASVIDWLASQ